MPQYTATSLKRRTRAFLAVVICALVALSGRLVYIQVFQSSTLRFLAAEQWYRDLPLGAQRGKILDCKGRVMAESVATYSIYIRPVAIKNPELVADIISRETGLNYQGVYAKAVSRTVSEWLIKMQVEKSVAMKIVEHDVDGIFISQTYRRTYPVGATGGQILGLVSVDSVGQEGIEAYYNNILSGTDGRIAQPSDLRGVPREDGAQYYSRPTAGTDITLHADAVVQNILQTKLNAAYHEQGAKSVAGLVYDIETGGIIASGAAPYYDMNDQPRDDVSTLMAQIKNFPVVNVLEPGSTFKVITLAAALNEGLTDETDKFNCPGFRMIDNERVKCWRTRGHGVQTLAEGVCNSCNCVFMDLALRLGVEKYYEYLNLFGMGQKTGVDFFGEPSGLVLNKKYVRNVDLARIGFGQAIATSPVQFQSIVSAIVGTGELKTPRFVKSINEAGVEIVSEIRRRILSTETALRVRELLYNVVNMGSGKHAQVNGYQIGGKTGTAQKYKNGIIDQGKYISSFMGFLTVNGAAKYSVYFYVDEPCKQGYYGSIVAAPYVGKIFAEMIAYLQIAPDPAHTKPVFAKDYVTLPSVAQADLTKTVARLQSFGFFVQVEGEGNIALGTFPAAGTNLKRGSPVVIRT